MASEHVKEFTDANFDSEVLKSSTPVLVDFWAEWCPPCKALGPTIDKLAGDYAGKVKYGIASIPTILVFKDGQIAHKIVGFKKEADFKAVLDSI
jgi:thioredoxin 1